MILPGYFDYARRLGYRRKWFATILCIQLGAVLFEGVSVGMILPILQAMNTSEADASGLNSQLLGRLKSYASEYGIEINLASLLMFAFAAILLRQVFMYWREVYVASVQYELMRTVRNIGFERFLHARFAYHDKVRSGDFVNELTTELHRATVAMTLGATLMGYLILCASYVVIVFMLSPDLTLAALFIFALAAVILFRVVRRIREFGQRVTIANQDMSSFLVERLKAVRLVRLSGVEEAEQKALAVHTLEQRDHQFNLRKMLTLFSVLIEPVVVGISFVLLYFSTTVFTLEFETILLFFFILLRLVPVTKEAFLTRQSYISLLASIETLDKRLSELSEFKDPKGGSRKLEGLKQGITLQDVTFRYGEEEDGNRVPALEGLNLEIPARQMTALVGPSGAGKSTLVDLLPRLREAQKGDILFDDNPQKDFDTVSLRRAVAFAPQQPQMFDVTVKEHIRYGLPDATMEQVCEAARLAQADGFIEALPDGYDTMLGEGGSRLSGGQRQRLDLARALVRRAPILVLDEPTANLDAEAESLFRAALDKIRAETDMTIIIIGHRFSTVMGADQIVVLKAGSVDEIGTHRKLMKSGGWYANAFKSQHQVAELTPVTN